MQVAISWCLVEEAKDINSFVGRILLRDLFEFYFPNRVLPGIAFTKSGKPYFIDSSIHFSISHTEHYVACALSCSRIGLDIEEMKIYDEKLPTKLYTRRQQEFVSNASDPQRAFFTIWTEREAVFKASNQTGDSILSHIEGIGSYRYEGDHWNTTQLNLSEQLVCSLATSNLDGQPTIHLNGPRVYKDILTSNGS